ncbi:MalM family protein [Pseudomonas sp. UBA2684]|uniref:MalM family protein n=1 Tax=Pseudomonas sp. UBA2684 TaxID=1947311 RepID=UPI000E8AA732|nr:MalM family protein [Pseudomonas sp. UBA2684]HBX57955.1 transcriptional regulator [Pseudomonas sp.]|tara:strand:+ start:27939 stop:29093 length:1155 start_codon:yes stop_codon:yes gene_type:complete
MRNLLLFLGLSCVASVAVASGRYLTWVDDLGRVHNTFVDSRYSAQQRQAAQRITLSDQARMRDASAGGWPGAPNRGESKRRYFTWVDAGGNLQNSFYAGSQQQAGGNEVLLASGERSSDYIDSDVLEGRGYARSEQGGQYFTWVDEQGRMRNSSVPAAGQGPSRGTASQPISFSEGRQVEFANKPERLPGLDGQPTAAMQALLAGSEKPGGALHQALLERCCAQLTDEAFTDLSADEPRYEELSRFSPSLDFPMGRSYYAALKLPRAQGTYGLRVRSFANKQVVYPSLLFLDEAKRPTRLVSDAVYQLHAETWYRYAFIEGVVPVKAAAGERYVLLLTTDEDRHLQTLDNKPFKRPLQGLAVDEAGMQTHAHSDEGAFELAIVR